jgi:hypothetical protein
LIEKLFSFLLITWNSPKIMNLVKVFLIYCLMMIGNKSFTKYLQINYVEEEICCSILPSMFELKSGLSLVVTSCNLL